MSHNLFLFSHDLRIQDNRALYAAAQASSRLSLVYCFDQNERKFDNSDCQFLGDHRYSFIKQLLQHLQQELVELKQHLLVINDTGVKNLSKYIIDNKISYLYCSSPLANYEQQKLDTLKALTNITIVSISQHTLFSQQDLPFALDKLPASFSQFRRQIEKVKISVEPCQQLVSLPPPLNQTNTSSIAEQPFNSQQCLTKYFSTDRALSYKETRNNLDNVTSSTRFSAPLASGGISIRQVWWTLKLFEQHHGANESTYWIGFELLWREYFHWLLKLYQDRFFYFKGIANKRPHTSFYPQRFALFCRGKTSSPLVNATVNQLTQTGYISNRARQIVASYFVNELSLDWRYGARFFQMHLIDYDVAINWGNWQYIAGVGCDPRGGRHFNINKQQQLYDPKGDYIRRWQGDIGDEQDDTDMTGWPRVTTSEGET